jgi:hypothetical protein
VHYALLLVLPWALHGPAATLLGAAGYSTTLSIILAMVFFVSHNVPQSKPLPAGGDTKGVLYQDVADRDWGVQQVGDGSGCAAQRDVPGRRGGGSVIGGCRAGLKQALSGGARAGACVSVHTRSAVGITAATCGRAGATIAGLDGTTSCAADPG